MTDFKGEILFRGLPLTNLGSLYLSVCLSFVHTCHSLFLLVYCQSSQIRMEPFGDEGFGPFSLLLYSPDLGHAWHIAGIHWQMNEWSRVIVGDSGVGSGSDYLWVLPSSRILSFVLLWSAPCGPRHLEPPLAEKACNWEDHEGHVCRFLSRCGMHAASAE